MPLKILLLAPQPFFVQRGTPIATRMLIETLTERGHTVDVIAFAEGEEVSIPGCTISRVPSLPGLKNVPPGFSLKKLVCDAILFPMSAYRLMTRRYDVIHAIEESAFIAMTLSPLARVPYVYDVDSSIPEQINDKRPLPAWLYKFLMSAERMALRRSAGAVTCCRALETLVRENAPATPVATVEDITMLEPARHGEEPADVHAHAPVEAQGQAQGKLPVIMYVGNLESYQGVDLLIDGLALALKSGAKARVVIIGGTTDHIAAGRKRAAGLGIGNYVTFLGPRPVEMLGPYLRAADIVASPRTQGRNTPMKVYSYLDSGRPLIATRLPTHTQVLDDDIAMLVEPTPQSMADGLIRLLSDKELAQGLAERAGERVRREFSRPAFNRKLIAFYEGVIAAKLKRKDAGVTAKLAADNN